TFKLLYAEVKDLRKKAGTVYEKMLSRITVNIDWQLDFPIVKEKVCFHGGEYINNSLEILENPEKLEEIITADVLDAWFPPSPKVLEVLNKNLSLLIKTSPPVDGRFVEEKIASVRNMSKDNILVGSGSSDLIFQSFLHLLNDKSKVLLLDPSYGEYAHILKNVIKCGFDRFFLEESDSFCLNIEKFGEILTKNYHMVVIINPNNPTGNLIDKISLKNIVEKTDKNTIFWIDETYIDYVGKSYSLEELTKTHKNIIICKSLSKIFAFSGLRAAYLCSSTDIISKLRSITPPWQLSFLAQVAIFQAIDDYSYYQKKYEETSELREDFVNELSKIKNINIISHGANFILCKITDDMIKLVDLIDYCKNHNLYLRDVTNMGSNFHNRFFRIAVKDKDSNKKTVEIIKNFWSNNERR
ncbi:MAG TPA: histidinol-phosphate transaminase, partial [Spirochaetota bacterium]|nr:histidinol-phosphate transaminase [Spirochaetota bacterium]